MNQSQNFYNNLFFNHQLNYSNNKTVYLIKQIYTEYLPLWLKTLVKENYLSINEINFINNDIDGFNSYVENIKNPFIIDYKTDITNLADDILINGLYFPFFSKGNSIFLGQHRAYALKQKKINKSFLNFKFNPIQNNRPVLCCFIDINNFTFYRQLQPKEKVFETLFLFMDHFPFVFYDYIDQILPNSFFQNLKSFKSFMEDD